MKYKIIGVTFLFLGLGISTAVALGSNGSFETGITPGAFTTLSAGDTTSITDWSVNAGNIDYIGSYWVASEGGKSIDMNGDVAGTISQTIPTTIGNAYEVIFDLSGNSACGASDKVLSVGATGATPTEYHYDTVVEGNSTANMKWKKMIYPFTATSVSTTITFASGMSGFCGPALDNVKVNGAPVLAPIGGKIVDELVPLTFTATAVDTDPLTYSLVGIIPSGASIDPVTGIFTWTPTEAQGGILYTFDVKVSDGTLSSSETITVTVNEVNIAPFAVNDTTSTNEDTAKVITTASLLSNDTDADLPADTLLLTSIATPTHGTAVLSEGSILYTPILNFNGTDTFEYTLSDGTATTSGLVTITVNPVNDAPTISLVGSSEIGLIVGDTYNEQGATYVDVDDSELTIYTAGEVNTAIAGTYTVSYSVSDEEFTATTSRKVIVSALPPRDICLNIEGVQTSIPEGFHRTGELDCTRDAVVGGGSVPVSFLMSLPVPPSPTGLVLGATTSDTPVACGALYLSDYLKMGSKNDIEQVKKLQIFLNKHLGLSLPISGVFGPKTADAVRQFQLENADQILAPWQTFGFNIKKPTGHVYKTTKRWINLMECSTLNIPMPDLSQG